MQKLVNYEVRTIKTFIKISDKLDVNYLRLSNSPELCYKIIKPLFDLQDHMQEHFLILALNGNNNLLGYKFIASGAMQECQVDMRILFRNALLLGASGIVIAHNHPSGQLKPSECDEIMTSQVKKAGNIIGIYLLDHIILSELSDSWFSFKTSGLI